MGVFMTDARQQRGLEIAKVARIDRKGDVYLVPSMSGNGRYTVNPTAETCTCPDCQNGHKCKHIYAVDFIMGRQTTQNVDGSTTVTDTVSIKATKRTTYPQDWPAYNEAQTHEQDEFRRLLGALCTGLETPPPKSAKGGRPTLPLRDAVFSVVFKVYSTFSGRRFISDLRAAHADGYISRLPHFNSIFNYLDNPVISPILTQMIVESAKPLAAVETDFAADSSGFATSRFIRWFDHKYGTVKVEHDWVKVHIMCGVKTNVITAVEVHGKFTQDGPLLPVLADTTAQSFKLKEVSADKGYASIANTEAIAKHGATPFLMFKANHSGIGGGLWGKMYHFFSFKRDEFLTHYHKRSNIESTFSMIKAKFGDSVRSKTETAMKNEALCKLLAHNICCLIHAAYELGIDPIFWQSTEGSIKIPS
jgi:transposase